MDSVPKKKKKKKKSLRNTEQFEDCYILSAEVLGEGARSVVRSAVDKTSGERVAVKLVSVRAEKDSKSLWRELRLMQQCCTTDHANIVQLLRSFESPSRFVFVFEYMEGGALFNFLEDRGHLTEQEASDIIRDAASALSFCHRQGVCHRDLKPENLLCVSVDAPSPVKVSDFGLGAGGVGGASTPRLHTPVGTAQFLAPEVVNALLDPDESYDKRCDVWSLGVILYMMLGGYPPFMAWCGNDCGWQEGGGACEDCEDAQWEAITTNDLRFDDEEWEHVSARAKDLLVCMLTKEAEDRYTIDEVLHHRWLSERVGGEEEKMLRSVSVHGVSRLARFASEANLIKRMATMESLQSLSQTLELPSTNDDLTRSALSMENIFRFARAMHRVDSFNSVNSLSGEEDRLDVPGSPGSPIAPLSPARRRRRPPAISSDDEDDREDGAAQRRT